MKFFETIQGEKVHLTPGKKVIPASEFSVLMEAKELLEKVCKEGEQYRQETADECEKLREKAEERGFEEGLLKWNEKIDEMEKEIAKVRKEMEHLLVPLALASVKKIIGREVELKPETIVDIIATSLKGVSHHRKIALFVNKNDLEIIEKNRLQLKALFEHLQSLTITTRDDIPQGGCIIETEAGIVNVGLEQQLGALETAFRSFVQNLEKKGAL